MFFLVFQGMYIKSTYDGLHVITGTTENVSFQLLEVLDKALTVSYSNYNHLPRRLSQHFDLVFAHWAPPFL